MWTEEKRQQLDQLRTKELAVSLTADEQMQLDQLFAELDCDEAALLRPAIEQMQAEHQQAASEISFLQRKKELLEILAAREEQLLERAANVLRGVHAEKAKLRAEYEQALAEGNRAA